MKTWEIKIGKKSIIVYSKNKPIIKIIYEKDFNGLKCNAIYIDEAITKKIK